MPPNRRVDVMNVPSYDNGNITVRAGRNVATVSTHKPEIVRPQRIVSSKVSISYSPASYSHAPTAKQLTGATPAPGMAKYVNKPLPPVPGAFPSGAAARPRGVTKPSVNVNKPLPPTPVQYRPTPNGVYTSTGQRVQKPVEVSAWSSTTASTRQQRRRKINAKVKTLKSAGAELYRAVDPYKNTPMARPIVPVTRSGYNPATVNDSRRAAAGAATRFNSRNQEEVASEARLENARRMVRLAQLGQFLRPFERPEWRALTVREQAIIKHELEMESMRKAKIAAKRMPKKESRCEIM